MKSTKIVATISDQRCEVEFIRSLYAEGMNVARMNTAHIDAEGFNRVITNIREVSSHIAILVDTKGPEMRTTIAENDGIQILTHDIIRVSGNPEGVTTNENIYVTYPHFVRDLRVGNDILFDDGEIELRVIEKNDDYLLCEALNDGKLGSRKSVNVPGVRINLPSLTEKDKKNILLAIEKDVDFIAHSFVRNKQDVLDIQEILDAHNSPIKIIAKIENQEGVDNIDEILESAYGVMIARGDLGIEVPQEKIPGIQRKLIKKCVQAKRPVIVATQMLHTMINNPRPTRAEVTDIANAIYYRTDALMLSGETAYGKYPVEAVRTMARIAKEAENTKMSENDIPIDIETDDITSYLAHAAVCTGENLDVKAILTDTYSGRTARYLAAYRGSNPIWAICYHERSTRLLALSYGVFPMYQPETENTRQYLMLALKNLLNVGWISKEDSICYLSGSYGEGCGTTFLEINRAGKIFDSGEKYILPNF